MAPDSCDLCFSFLAHKPISAGSKATVSEHKAVSVPGQESFIPPTVVLKQNPIEVFENGVISITQ